MLTQSWATNQPLTGRGRVWAGRYRELPSTAAGV